MWVKFIFSTSVSLLWRHLWKNKFNFVSIFMESKWKKIHWVSCGQKMKESWKDLKLKQRKTELISKKLNRNRNYIFVNNEKNQSIDVNRLVNDIAENIQVFSRQKYIYTGIQICVYTHTYVVICTTFLWIYCGCFNIYLYIFVWVSLW